MLSLLRAAGLPDGVINLVHGAGAEIGGVALAHRDLAAVHFTGSTATFRYLFRAVGANVDRYRGHPRVVGETGGRDSCSRRSASADLTALTEAVVDGAFDYQGQKLLRPRAVSTYHVRCGPRSATGWWRARKP